MVLMWTRGDQKSVHIGHANPAFMGLSFNNFQPLVWWKVLGAHYYNLEVVHLGDVTNKIIVINK